MDGPINKYVDSSHRLRHVCPQTTEGFHSTNQIFLDGQFQTSFILFRSSVDVCAVVEKEQSRVTISICQKGKRQVIYVQIKSIYSEKAIKFCEIFTLLLTTVKFIYSEKATKFCEIFTLLLTTVHCTFSQK